MNQSTFQLLGNVASADFYLCEGSDITLMMFGRKSRDFSHGMDRPL